MVDLVTGKVVRDKIPSILADAGLKIEVRTLSEWEAYEALIDKLSEEGVEMVEAINAYGRGEAYDGIENNVRGVAEEIVDIIEVLMGIGKLFNILPEDIQEVMDRKYEERGGYDEVLFVRLLDGTEKD